MIPGNADVVALLERWLEEAKLGEINHVALIACQKPDQVACDVAGAIEMERYLAHGIEGLKGRIGQLIRDRQPPVRDPNLGADYVCYRPAQQPASFDFTSWLIQREMDRVREGAPSPLKVSLWTPPGVTYARRMLDSVLRAMVPLLGAVEDPVAQRGRLAPLDAGFISIVAASRAGEKVPKFKAPGVPYYPNQVTITLREADYDVTRNSNLPAWLKFADYLTKRGENVVFIRDTAKAHEPLGPFKTWPRASVDLHARLALYESAKCNLFVANGPWSLALFSDCPWLMFPGLSEGDPCPVSHPSWWQQYHGIGPGEQFPWSRPDQRIVWARDDYETLVEAWESQGALRQVA